MVPNPQSALPLPARPNLEHYRKLAKQLVKACKSGDELGMGDWAQKTLASKCTLASAHFVIARLHGFESWPKFSKHIEALSRKNSLISNFEAAAAAIVNGDIAKLKRLLGVDPKLIEAVSTREHGATLLHYISANGVESFRQKTPENIVRIAELLLDAGAVIDATANVYGGGCTTLGLAATSVHPERAGVQEGLLQLLLDHGARLEQPPIAGNRQSIVVACLANGRGKAAEFLACRGAPLDFISAAGIGRLDVAERLLTEVTEEDLRDGFLYACQYGRIEVVKFLLEKGVDLTASGRDGQTGLHWAVIGGHPDMVEFLLRRGAPLEVTNIYGGTVLGQALWSARNGADPDVSIAILELLFAACARLPLRRDPVNARVDEWLARRIADKRS